MIYANGKATEGLVQHELNKISLVIAAHYHQTMFELTRKISFGQ